MPLLIALIGAVVGPSQENEEDAKLIQRIVTGENSAMAVLYDRYSAVLYTFGLRVLRSREETADLLQEVFLQVWNKADSYRREKGTVYTWLVTMTRNRAIDLLRSKKHKQQSQTLDVGDLSLVADAQQTNPHTRTEIGEDQQLVANALKRLTKDQQQVIALAYYEGYSQSEIANKLNVPLGTVKSRMRKGLMEMRSMLGKSV